MSGDHSFWHERCTYIAYGGVLIPTFIKKALSWFREEPASSICLQCGLPSGRQFMMVTDETIMHRHQCSWCSGVLYVPGPVFSCKACAEDIGAGQSAA